MTKAWQAMEIFPSRLYLNFSQLQGHDVKMSATKFIRAQTFTQMEDQGTAQNGGPEQGNAEMGSPTQRCSKRKKSEPNEFFPESEQMHVDNLITTDELFQWVNHFSSGGDLPTTQLLIKFINSTNVPQQLNGEQMKEWIRMRHMKNNEEINDSQQMNFPQQMNYQTLSKSAQQLWTLKQMNNQNRNGEALYKYGLFLEKWG